MKHSILKFIAIFLLPLMATLNCPLNVTAAPWGGDRTDIEIGHERSEAITAGKRFELQAEIEADSAVDVARIYFKAIEASDYSFVPMEWQGNSRYVAVLPAPAKGCEAIDYVILVKNGNNEVVKSQIFRLVVDDQDDVDNSLIAEDPINVYTELLEAPQEVAGFQDNIAIDIVESTQKFGVIAGLYNSVTAGESTSNAVAKGSTTASGSITSNSMLLYGLAGAAAAVGVAALAGGGGSDSGGGSELTSSSIVGTWHCVERVKSSGQVLFNGTFKFSSNGTFCASSGIRGTWNLSGSTLSLRNQSGVTASGKVSGNSSIFTLNSQYTAITFSR